MAREIPKVDGADERVLPSSATQNGETIHPQGDNEQGVPNGDTLHSQVPNASGSVPLPNGNVISAEGGDSESNIGDQARGAIRRPSLATRRRSQHRLDMPDSGTGGGGDSWDTAANFGNAYHNHFMMPPTGDAGTANTDVAREGQVLFLNFLREEIRRQNIREPRCLTPVVGEPDMEVVTRRWFVTHSWTETGRELRQVADAFAVSPERQTVRARAEEVEIESLTSDNFVDLLTGMFDGGWTQERVIVLFCFCSDVLVRALKEHLISRFEKLVDWSVNFICRRVAVWVQDHGGWESVIRTSMSLFSYAAFITVCCIGIIAGVVYIRKNL